MPPKQVCISDFASKISEVYYGDACRSSGSSCIQQPSPATMMCDPVYLHFFFELMHMAISASVSTVFMALYKFCYYYYYYYY